MRNSRLLFWLIILFILVVVFVDAPFKKPISIDTTKVAILKKLPFKTTFPFFAFHKGLDLEGGVSLTYKAQVQKLPQDQRQSALDSAQNVIERRVNYFGVSEPVVQTAMVNNESRILVELPGVTNVNQAINLVGQTARLDFLEVKEATTSAASPQFIPTGLTGADLQTAQASFDTQTGAPVVSFTVSSKSQDKFLKETERLIGKRMAIVLDNQLISAPPTVQAGIRDQGQITGQFTTDQAKLLALQLNAGALPIPLTMLSQRVVGPTLGAASLQASLFAGILGFFVIVLFMCILYGCLGIIASAALILYALSVLALFRVIPVVLTLAGIAGFILSIGMAVDANILIFERIKEEIRSGKSQDVAMELGFKRAWTSIRDSNASSLITSGILYYFGTGIVRGFAFTLALGVLVSMFSAIVVTRTFLRIMYR